MAFTATTPVNNTVTHHAPIVTSLNRDAANVKAPLGGVIVSSLNTATATATVVGHKQKQPKIRTRDKIERLVAEGAKNYPAYLKLIYTGDSELSSEDEPHGVGAMTHHHFGLNERGEFHRYADVTDGGSSTLVDTNFGHQCPRRLGGVSPESCKLLDPGREKLPTPTTVDECRHPDMTTEMSRRHGGFLI